MMRKIKQILQLVVFCALCLTEVGHADMMKCVIKKFPEITNYFDAKDSKQRKKCVTKPVAVVNSNGKKIRNRYKNSPNMQVLAAKDVKPMG